MYRSRNSNPSQPNQSPCYWTNMPRLSTQRTQTVQLKRWEACLYKFDGHTPEKSRNGWDTGSHHPRPCLHLNWLRLPSSSSCPLPPNLPLLSSPPRLNSREVVNLFFLLHQLVSWLPFPTIVNDKVLWEWNVLPVFLRQPRSESSHITNPIPSSICNKRNTMIFYQYTPPPILPCRQMSS